MQKRNVVNIYVVYHVNKSNIMIYDIDMLGRVLSISKHVIEFVKFYFNRKGFRNIALSFLPEIADI